MLQKTSRGNVLPDTGGSQYSSSIFMNVAKIILTRCQIFLLKFNFRSALQTLSYRYQGKWGEKGEREERGGYKKGAFATRS